MVWTNYFYIAIINYYVTLIMIEGLNTDQLKSAFSFLLT